jgi:hypothetical protein
MPNTTTLIGINVPGMTITYIHFNNTLLEKLQEIATRRSKSIEGLILEVLSKYTKRVRRIQFKHFKIAEKNTEILKHEFGEGYPALKLKHDKDNEAT